MAKIAPTRGPAAPRIKSFPEPVSRLASVRTDALSLLPMPDWKDGLARFLQEVAAN